MAYNLYQTVNNPATEQPRQGAPVPAPAGGLAVAGE
jgi:hypothetical protein